MRREALLLAASLVLVGCDESRFNLCPNDGGGPEGCLRCVRDSDCAVGEYCRRTFRNCSESSDRVTIETASCAPVPCGGNPCPAKTCATDEDCGSPGRCRDGQCEESGCARLLECDPNCVAVPCVGCACPSCGNSSSSQ
ncbi:MAG: hypothetical protein QM765_36940 [Myxococcales bacterium]